jgi:hypothetical protein
MTIQLEQFAMILGPVRSAQMIGKKLPAWPFALAAAAAL